MGRIATAHGGNNPTTHQCGLCGDFGHNRRTCPLAQDNGGGFLLPATRPLPNKTYKCGHCGKVGHNKRTCPTLQRRKDFLAEAEKNEPKLNLEIDTLCQICDEEPMESDIELTPTPRSEVSTPDTIPFPEDEDQEVDIATEGFQADWGNLPQECLEIILAEVERHNQEWWENAIHFTTWEGKDRSKFQIIRSRAEGGDLSLFEVDRDVSDGWQQEAICKSIRTIADILDRRGLRHRVEAHSNLNPRHLKYKYIRKEIGTPRPLWKMTKVDRDRAIANEFCGTWCVPTNSLAELGAAEWRASR